MHSDQQSTSSVPFSLPKRNAQPADPPRSAFSLPFDEQATALRNLVSKSEDFRLIEKQRTRFNLLRVLSVDQGEIRHSNILAWLLRPEETHGLRDKFLRRWLTRVYSDAQPEQGGTIEPVTIDTMEFRDVEVRREWRNLDLLIEMRDADGAKWVIAVENKLAACQTQNQLVGYRAKITAAFGGKMSRCAYIYLRADSTDDPEDDFWVPATHRQIYEVLNELVDQEGDVIGRDPEVLLRHYLQVLKTFVMDKPEIEQLARRIYHAHGDQGRRI
jgi:hypothetical protein